MEKGVTLMNDREAAKGMVEKQKKQIHGQAVEELYDFICYEIKKRKQNPQ